MMASIPANTTNIMLRCGERAGGDFGGSVSSTPLVIDCQTIPERSNFRLKRDGTRWNRHRALVLQWSTIFSEDRYTLFRIVLQRRNYRDILTNFVPARSDNRVMVTATASEATIGSVFGSAVGGRALALSILW